MVGDASAASWYNSSWLKARQITVDDTDITADLTNYPLYVNLTSVNIGTDSQADCDDFVFVDYYNVTKFDHEIETCDDANNWAEFWVEVPTVFNANATIVNMYYDNAATTDQQNTQETWNSGFQAVWHLNGTFIDSTASPITCTNSGTSVRDNMYIGDTRSWDGVDDYLECGSTIDNIFDGGGTVSAWINYTSDGEANANIFSKQSVGNDGWQVRTGAAASSPATLAFAIFGATDAAWTSNVPNIPFAKWVFATITYDDDSALNNPIIYINGSSVAATLSGTPLYTSEAADILCLGNQANGAGGCLTSGTVDGSMDEFRMNNGILSADWINADWQCQRGAVDGNSCITIGSQGTEPVAGDTVTVSDEGAGEDSVSYQTENTVNLTDEGAGEDIVAAFGDSTVNITDEGAGEDSVTAETPGLVTLTDEGAGEDSAGINIVTVTDEGAGEDSIPSPAVSTSTRNAIVIYLNSPTETRLGGVFSGFCDTVNNYTMYGIHLNGSIACWKLP